MTRLQRLYLSLPLVLILQPSAQAQFTVFDPSHFVLLVAYTIP